MGISDELPAGPAHTPLTKVVSNNDSPGGGLGILQQTSSVEPLGGSSDTDPSTPLLVSQISTTTIEIQPPKEDIATTIEDEQKQQLLIQNGGGGGGGCSEAVVIEPAKKRSVRLRTKSQDEFLPVSWARRCV